MEMDLSSEASLNMTSLYVNVLPEMNGVLANSILEKEETKNE